MTKSCHRDFSSLQWVTSFLQANTLGTTQPNHPLWGPRCNHSTGRSHEAIRNPLLSSELRDIIILGAVLANLSITVRSSSTVVSTACSDASVAEPQCTPDFFNFIARPALVPLGSQTLFNFTRQKQHPPRLSSSQAVHGQLPPSSMSKRRQPTTSLLYE